MNSRKHLFLLRPLALFAWMLASLTASSLLAQNAVPGTIEAENFSAMSGVQTEACSEGGLNVSYIDTGDWMDYAINPSPPVLYTVDLRVASASSGGTVRIMSGSTVLATLTIPVTGAWQTWTTVSSTLNLAAGNQTIRLDVVSGGWNINWIRFRDPISSPEFPWDNGVRLRELEHHRHQLDGARVEQWLWQYGQVFHGRRHDQPFEHRGLGHCLRRPRGKHPRRELQRRLLAGEQPDGSGPVQQHQAAPRIQR